MWWILETIPLGITALASSAGMVLLGINNFKEAFSSFAHPIIFLFLGSFLLARAFETHQLDKRFSLFIMTRKFIAQKPQRVIFALMFSSFVLSMWLSNTATIAMLLPIALALSKKLFPNDKKSTALFLISLAYSASLGGTVTPVGSPPNLIAIAFLEELSSIKIGFLNWVFYAAPFSIVSFSLLSYFFIKKLKIKDNPDLNLSTFKKDYSELGPMRPQEKIVINVFMTVVFFWIVPNALQLILGKGHGISIWFNAHLPLALTAVLGAVLLFLVRIDQKPLLDEESLSRIDWSTLFLFGGGLSLGISISQTGLSQVIFSGLFHNIDTNTFVLTAVLIVLFCIFFTEFSSNTATANILIPLVLGGSILQINKAESIAIVLALACSCAFMMPVATPPNAIIYGSKKVPLSTMMRAGLKWNLICWVLLSFLLIAWNS